MCGPSEALTSIPGITGTEYSLPWILLTDSIRLWSVMATPTRRAWASSISRSTSVKESEQLVWKCMSTAIFPSSSRALKSGLQYSTSNQATFD